MSTETKAPYGYCPICGAPGRSRERRPNGNDRCANGHTYPSAQAVKTDARPAPQGTPDRGDDLTEAQAQWLGNPTDSELIDQLFVYRQHVNDSRACGDPEDPHHLWGMQTLQAEWDRRCAEREAEKAELARLREVERRHRALGSELVESLWGEGRSLDDYGDLFDLLESHCVIAKAPEPYDPEKHGHVHEDVAPGDEWYQLAWKIEPQPQEASEGQGGEA